MGSVGSQSAVCCWSVRLVVGRLEVILRGMRRRLDAEGVKQVAIDRRIENPIFGGGVLAIFDVGWCRKRPRAGALGGATKFGKFTETAEHSAVAVSPRIS